MGGVDDGDDGDAGASARANVMVFVRNLPYDCDDEKLEELFSNEFGPIKESWVVREKGSSTHRGFGYVKFALPEDARMACERSGKVEIDGRKLAIVLAKKKEAPVVTDKGGTEAKEAEEEKKKERARKAETVKRERVKKSAAGGALGPKDAPRTVVIGGLKIGGEIEGVDVDAALELARSVGKVESVTSPCPDDVMKLAKIREDGCTRGAVLAVYADEAAAREAVRKLHGVAPKSKKKKRAKRKNASADADDDGDKECIWARQLGGEGSKPKQWRVIVRNLAFTATVEAIREALSAAGFVWDINMPTDFHNKPKGFAFVTYTSKADADKAVSDCNGVSISGRQVAVDIAVSKSKYQASEAAPAEVTAAVEETQKDDPANDHGSGSDSDDSDDSDKTSSESEDEETQEKNMMSRLLGKVMSSDAPSTTKPERRAPIVEKKAPAAAEGGGNRTQSDDATKPGVEPAWQGAKGINADDEEQEAQNFTVFVRNLPLEANWEHLKEKMMKFGRVKSCRVVKDKATGKHKGTAFVDFVTSDAANAAVEASENETSGVYVAGRPITIALAVSKAEAADMMARQGSKFRNASKHRDNRNLYLAQEGDIHEASAAADGVSKSDIEKRRRSNEERQLKLKNPNFFVSRTRLSVRNIPPEIDPKTLKKMFYDAVKQRSTQAEPKILHAKLLYDNTKADENGKPRSKGMGFVEFSEHEHALNALRALNNNPLAFSSRARRPIVEFSIEDARAVRKLEIKAKHRDEQQKKRVATDGEKPRGAEQAAKRVAKKEGKSAPESSGPPKRDRPNDKKRERAPRDDRANKKAANNVRTDNNKAQPSDVPKVRQRAMDERKRDDRDAKRRRAAEDRDAKPKKKPHGQDKRDRTDDLIDNYFKANAVKANLGSWL